MVLWSGDDLWWWRGLVMMTCDDDVVWLWLVMVMWSGVGEPWAWVVGGRSVESSSGECEATRGVTVGCHSTETVQWLVLQCHWQTMRPTFLCNVRPCMCYLSWCVNVSKTISRVAVDGLPGTCDMWWMVGSISHPPWPLLCNVAVKHWS